MNILDKIVLETKKRISEKKVDLVEASEAKQSTINPFTAALKKPGLSIIAEVKKASPSKGIIAKDFDPLKAALTYEKNGACAISVLTEPKFFLGSDEYLLNISKVVKLPLLRKDFVIDKSMIFQAKILGAAATLLIVSILSDSQLKEYLQICSSINLAALVEVHNENEVERALIAGAEIIGINNRDLSTFKEDISTTARLKPLIPKDKIVVSESAIKTKADIDYVASLGVDAALIGEALMLNPELLL